MIMQRPSGLLTATAVPDGMTVRQRRVEITAQRRQGPSRPRTITVDSEMLPTYRIEFERQGWRILRERPV